MPQQLASISLACVHSRLWQRMHGLACERMPSACMGLHVSACPGAWLQIDPGHRAACRVIGAIAASWLLVDGELEHDEDGGRRRCGTDLDDADRQMKVQA
jgi:hypothetical protein